MPADADFDMPTTVANRSRSISRTVTIAAVIWISAVVSAFLILPPLLHPPLDQDQLRGLSPEQRISLQQEQRKLQDDIRTTLVQGSVGLLALAGAGIGVYVGLRQLQLAREGQITDRFLRAVDQLGSDKPDVRFGGIYALERLAKDSPSDRSAIAEVLSAFVRRCLPGSDATDEYILPLPFRSPDAQAALTVLCRSPLADDRIEPGARSLDLSRTDLRRADLHHAHLQGANLWSARLEGADLRGANLRDAMLERAHFGKFQARNPAYQSGADLSGADLTGAKLEYSVDLHLAVTHGTIGLPQRGA